MKKLKILLTYISSNRVWIITLACLDLFFIFLAWLANPDYFINYVALIIFVSFAALAIPLAISIRKRNRADVIFRRFLLEPDDTNEYLLCEAVLVGMNELYGAYLSMSELCALGAKIGADVPFALMGGTCRVQGVGDFLKALPPVPECWFTVVMPDYGVSTPEAFAAYDRVGSSIHPDCGAQEAAIRAGDLDALCAAAGNALEECSGAKDTGAIKALLREHGAVTALMTGSGAAVFGVFRDEGAARAAAQAAKRRWKQVYVAQPDRGGARVSR